MALLLCAVCAANWRTPGLLGAGRRVTPGIDLCAAKSGTGEGELDTGRIRPVRAVKPKLLKNIRRESISKIVLDKVEEICYADGEAGRCGVTLCRGHTIVPGSLFMLVCIYGVDVPFLDTLQRFNVSYGSKVLLGSLHGKRYGVIGCLVFRQRKIQVLPRLALTYYCLIAAVLALGLGALWLSLRRKPCAALMRQLFFVPFAWLAAQLLLKGLDAASFQLEWELGWILLLALVIYSLLTLAWLVWRQHCSAA